MTKKDYALIAQAVRSARARFAESPYPDKIEIMNFAAIIIASELTKALNDASKLDVNGYRLFDAEKFRTACQG